MIVDSHAHIFQNWFGQCGMADRQVHLRYIQKNLTRPAARVYRARDGALASGQLLFREGDNSWAGLRDDVSFRVGLYGRLEFTVDGEDHYVQYMPVAMREIESTPEFMTAQMIAAGVDHCVLQAGFTYGYMNDYNALAQRAFPERFTGLFHVDEPMADQPYWLGETERALGPLGLRGLYYQLDGYARYGFRWWFDDARFDRFWELVEGAGVPVFFEAAGIPKYDRASYLEILRRLGGLQDRFPRIRWLIVLGPPPQHFAPDGRWEFPDVAERVYGRDTVWLEVCYPISWGGVWEYPYPEAQRLIEALRGRYGAEKLVWGSDMPNVERFATYRQTVDYVRRHCPGLSARDKDRVLGENVAELLGLDRERLAPGAGP